MRTEFDLYNICSCAGIFAIVFTNQSEFLAEKTCVTFLVCATALRFNYIKVLQTWSAYVDFVFMSPRLTLSLSLSLSSSYSLLFRVTWVVCVFLHLYVVCSVSFHSLLTIAHSIHATYRLSDRNRMRARTVNRVCKYAYNIIFFNEYR